MASKYCTIFATLLVFLMVVSPSLILQSEAGNGLTARELYQKPSHPPCMCCQKEPPPPGCYCACAVKVGEQT